MKLIKHLLPNKLEEAWQIVRENSVHSENAGGFSWWLALAQGCAGPRALSIFAAMELLRQPLPSTPLAAWNLKKPPMDQTSGTWSLSG